ncbi:MAG: hypothetical protein LBB59_04500 [Campylobacteraceae bacterium]|jgi:hypothetical protein|nr:hypothetical protein [Campylobacteraceae bacterium]
MATWTELPQTNIEPEKPIRASDIWAIYQDIKALAEGVEGAPKIQPAVVNFIQEGNTRFTKEYSGVTTATSYANNVRFFALRKGNLKFNATITGGKSGSITITAYGRWTINNSQVGNEFSSVGTTSTTNSQIFSVNFGDIVSFQLRSNAGGNCTYNNVFVGCSNIAEAVFGILIEDY